MTGSHRLAASLLVSLLALGCNADDAAVDTQRTWDGPFLLERMLIECDDNSWSYQVRTDGWGELVTVQIVVRDQGALLWQEAHEIPEVEYGDDWAQHEVDLDLAQTDDDYESSVATRIACEAKSFVTYAFSAWRYDGELEECAAWGIDPVGEFPDCANWGQVDHNLP